MKLLSVISILLILQSCAVFDESQQPETNKNTQSEGPELAENRAQARPPQRYSYLERVSVATPTSLAVMPVRSAVSISGTWVSRGPQPFSGSGAGQTVDTDGDGFADSGFTSGAAHTVIAHPSNADIVWVGGVNGGVWRTNNATAESPNWTAQTDNMPSMSIGAMDLDPTDASSNTLVAGFGRYSSFSSEGGLLAGAMRSTDGGSTWTHLSDSVLDTQNCSGIAARGSTLVMSAHRIDTTIADFGTGGVFRSTDTGASWSKIDGSSGSGLPESSVFDMAGDPTNANRLYVTAQGHGIYRSDDTGATWQRISSTNTNEIFAATSFNDNTLTTTPNIDNAEIAVAANGRLYVAIVHRGDTAVIEYTDNPGDAAPTWVRMDIPTTTYKASTTVNITDASNESPIVITTSAAHQLSTSDRVAIKGIQGNTAANGLFVVNKLTDNTFSLLYTSGNGTYASGGTATGVVSISGSGTIHYSILADKDNPNILYVGGQSHGGNVVSDGSVMGNIWRGDTAIAPTGESPSPQWAHLTLSNTISAIPTGGTATVTAPHADSREMAQDVNGNLLQTDDGGIYRHTNPRTNTGDWKSIIGDLVITEFHSVAYDTVSNILFGGTQDNGTAEQNKTTGSTYSDVTSGDGGVVAIDISTAKPNSVRYRSVQNFEGFAKAVVDKDNVVVNQTFPALTGKGDWRSNFYAPVALNNANPLRFVVGGENGILETTDQGETVTFHQTDPVTSGGLSFGASDNADAMYAAVTNYDQDVNGESIVLVRTSGSSAPTPTLTKYPGKSITGLMIHPSKGNTVFVIEASAVYMSSDAGLNWTNLTGNLTNSLLRSIELLPGTNEVLLVGGVRGVSAMALSDPGVWTSVGSGLPNTLVYDM